MLNFAPISTGRLDAFESLADWLDSIGGISPSRVLLRPPPGTATEDDLLRLVEGTGRPRRLVELIDNTLVEKSMGQLESLLAGLVITLVNIFVLPRRLGSVYATDCSIRMATRNVRLPDVAFVERATSGRKLSRERILSTWPDLVVEILSESNTAREIDLKLSEYFAIGTRLVWVIDWRSRSVEIYTSPGKPGRVLRDNAVLDGGEVLPGFTLELATLWNAVADATE